MLEISTILPLHSEEEPLLFCSIFADHPVDSTYPVPEFSQELPSIVSGIIIPVLSNTSHEEVLPELIIPVLVSVVISPVEV